jgi:flavin reductase (DIM6/NTAB) family NADH-FMN oxidoreductase RutF
LAPPIGPDDLRDAARLFASGVTIVTVDREGKPHGMTAIAFAAVSLEPPLVLVCLERNSRTRAAVATSGRFVVNILRSDQEDLARAFSLSGEKSFEGVAHEVDDSGAALLSDAIATMSCRTVEMVPGGDHDVYLAEVTAAVSREGSPLLYFDRDYRRLS